MPNRALATALVLSTLGGCAFFAALTGNDEEAQAQAQADAEAEAKRQAEEAARAQEQADQQFAAELEPLRAAASAEGATLDQVLEFVDKVTVAIQNGTITRGKVPATVTDEARAALDKQYAAVEKGKDAESAATRSTIESARGLLFASEGRNDEAANSYLAALLQQPTLPLFNTLAGLPKSPTSDAAVLQTCPLIRPQIDAAGLPDFIAVCLDAAAGDRSKLTWKNVKKDYKAHDDEMARREAEAARIAEEERIAAEAAAAQAAAAAAQSQMWAIAAVFASGNCRFQNCLKDGWEDSTDQGTVTTTCRFQNCLKDGWETRFPDGSTATTTCRFQDCMKDGWETRFPDGDTATTTCRFQNCPVDGWETRLPDGASATTTCRFQNCFKDGWETSMPEGSIACTCRFQDCLKDGIDCS
ncbi:hypothetical protein ACNOYE_32610 [Nannocystaceae bacterium ST9]